MTGCRLNDKCSFNVIAVIGTVVFDLVMPIAAQMIKTKAVGFQVNDFEQPRLQRNKLGGIHLALKDRILDPLAEIEASLGSAAQAGFPSGSGGRYIVSDQDIHGLGVLDLRGHSSTRKKGRVSVEISAQVSC